MSALPPRVAAITDMATVDLGVREYARAEIAAVAAAARINSVSMFLPGLQANPTGRKRHRAYLLGRTHPPSSSDDSKPSASHTIRPPTMVITGRTSSSRSGGTANGSSDRTTRSAS